METNTNKLDGENECSWVDLKAQVLMGDVDPGSSSMSRRCFSMKWENSDV